MAKNIQTHNAKAELVKKFLDYANIADSSYALLHYIKQNAKDEKEVKADRLKFYCACIDEKHITESISLESL